nr:NAD-dependent malate dehydrogenase (MDH) [Polytomella parva]|mmetsp:Transcript_12434/g.22258  ORF Transcript_12434/g.22258 Transcript_12434/m.22258 type:complete len:363 (-) Transcript_12434:627-1715(-)|eukprot:CAMPEP_0175057788 /NCGR_PEP_ID=MMETSP0052_2-20121109/11462_1 /TAXON_ID=51329 ORGANISM="Polytomella parva, Strain SAG 63-3" /NCGR_SAMPLE_ID=MMETSP0052_2 /ASSEMBLY_ACC=CAM_ASM_000194 /LENGTH=362 /DNA_ID=CAMNT_0016323047 /DNA_START=64 /DNA_END=1152 /DNA_ORIENTATION=+
MSKFFHFASAVALGASLAAGALSFLNNRKKKTLRVLITGAAGQIGYALAPMVASGYMLGPNQPIVLHLLDIEPAKKSLEGVKMELIDGAYPLLEGVVISTDVKTACQDVDIAIMVGGYPRRAGEERKDVMAKNVSIYAEQASALATYASKDVKIVVVANPANTNALILQRHAPNIPKENITALTRLDHNRAIGQVALQSNAHCTEVANVAIWGNHSSTQYPDVNHGTVKGKSIREVIHDDAYLDGEFVETVQQRGAAIIKARGLSSALSAAAAVSNHVRDWIQGTSFGKWVSMAVVSDGSYGVAEGLMFSFPVTCRDGKWKIVQGLHINEATQKKLDITEAELKEELKLAEEVLAEKFTETA